VTHPSRNRDVGHPAVGLDGPAKLIHGVPPPILWTQNPCFHEVTRRVAL